MENRQESLHDVIEARDTVHDQFDIANSIILIRVNTIVFIDCGAEVDTCIWESLFTIIIRCAELWPIHLIPLDEVAIGIEIGLFCCTAELILLSEELVCAKDSEDAEDEDDEEEDAEEAWNRAK